MCIIGKTPCWSVIILRDISEMRTHLSLTTPRPYLFAVLFVVVAAIFAGCNAPNVITENANVNDAMPADSPNTVDSVHLPYGNPSNAGANDKDNYLIVGEGSVISYNDSRGTANWIAWRTTRNDLGNSIPRPDFRHDPRLPAVFEPVEYYDYSGSGYDRGHLVPSADRFANKKLNNETFYLTNIMPQTPALNQKPWEKLESEIRSLVRARNGFDAYQIAGGYGSLPTKKGRLTAPTNCWKVVVLIPRGADPAAINERTRIIAVDMPNTKGIEDRPWRSFSTTVRAIEEKTGYDLFSALPKELQDKIETRIEIKNP